MGNIGGGFQINQAPVKISKQDLKVAGPIALMQTKSVLAVTIQILQHIKLNLDESTIKAAKRVVASIIGRLMCNIEELSSASPADQELKKAIVIRTTAIINMIATELKQSTELWEKAIVPVYLSAIQFMTRKLDSSEESSSSSSYEYTAFSGALIHAML